MLFHKNQDLILWLRDFNFCSTTFDIVPQKSRPHFMTPRLHILFHKNPDLILWLHYFIFCSTTFDIVPQKSRTLFMTPKLHFYSSIIILYMYLNVLSHDGIWTHSRCGELKQVKISISCVVMLLLHSTSRFQCDVVKLFLDLCSSIILASSKKSNSRIFPIFVEFLILVVEAKISSKISISRIFSNFRRIHNFGRWGVFDIPRVYTLRI